MKTLSLLILIYALCGCTNYLYQGISEYQNNGKTCTALVYWTDTNHWFDKESKTSTVVIKSAESTVSYSIPVIGSEPFALILPQGEYEQVMTQDNISAETSDSLNHDTQLYCGALRGKAAHEQGQSQQVSFQLICNKVPDPFSPSSGGLPARQTPYVFEMQTPQSQFSWLGQALIADLSQINCQ